MPVLELTEDQVIELIRQMTDEQKKRVLDVLTQPAAPRPRFGSAKGLITMSDDFDEPLEDFKEYME
jgi:uncharacterized protein DUF2281